jgi:microcystin-dependent protein
MTELVRARALETPDPRGCTHALEPLMNTHGLPDRGEAGPATNVIGMIKCFATKIPAYGAPACDGQPLRIREYEPLHAVIGKTYGSGPGQTFNLPDLRGRVVVAGSPGGGTERYLGLNCLIAFAEEAGQSNPMVGAIGLFAGASAPGGWLVANGSRVPISRYRRLFETIGTTYGGDGTSSFCLPDLSGRSIVGVGKGDHGPAVSPGQKVELPWGRGILAVGLQYIIACEGVFPPDRGPGYFPETDPVLSEVIPFAGTAIPGGWLPADGRLLSTTAYRGLYEMLGTNYGGDGKTSFGVPDLRGRMMMGAR